MENLSKSPHTSLASSTSMNSTLNSAFQTCSDTSDTVELFGPQQLFLKPVARLNVSVQLPQLKLPGKTISNWEVMEKLKHMVKPVQFTVLKVSKSTLEFIRFEGEIENKSNLNGVISHLDGRTIKLSGFSELLKIRAAEAKMSFPTRHTWDSYFRDAKNMNEMKPGERPDTIHLSNVPCKWFSSKHDASRGSDKPSEYIFRKVFEQFGEVRCVDIPMLDPFRSQMKAHISGMKTFSFGQELAFEGYVQFQEYVCFVKAMDALRGMKLLHKEGDKAYTASIKVDFDRTKHLSDASIRRRRVERDKLIARERETEERERRAREIAEKEAENLRKQKEEEQKEQEKLSEERKQRKAERHQARQLRRLKREEAQRINYNIAVEERKLLIAQRKLESIRLLDELFDRVKAVRQKEVSKKLEEESVPSEKKEKDNKENLEDKERELRSKLMKKFKCAQELQLKGQQEKLRQTIEGKNKLNSVLAGSRACGSDSENSTTSSSSDVSTPSKKRISSVRNSGEKDCNSNEQSQPSVWYDSMGMPGTSPVDFYAGLLGSHVTTPMALGLNSRFPGRFPFSRGGFYGEQGRWPRWSRSQRNRGYNNIAQNSYFYNNMSDYYKYFQKLAGHTTQSSSRSRSRSRSRSNSRSRSKHRTHSRSHHQSRSHSRSRRRLRSKSRSHSPSRNRKSRTRSRTSSKSRLKKASRSRSRTHSKKSSRSPCTRPGSRSRKENIQSRAQQARLTGTGSGQSQSASTSQSRSNSQSHDGLSQSQKQSDGASQLRSRERERSHMRSLSKDLSLSLSPSSEQTKPQNGSDCNVVKSKKLKEKDSKDYAKKRKKKQKHKKSKHKDTDKESEKHGKKVAN